MVLRFTGLRRLPAQVSNYRIRSDPGMIQAMYAMQIIPVLDLKAGRNGRETLDEAAREGAVA